MGLGMQGGNTRPIGSVGVLANIRLNGINGISGTWHSERILSNWMGLPGIRPAVCQPQLRPQIALRTGIFQVCFRCEYQSRIALQNFSGELSGGNGTRVESLAETYA